MRKTALLSGVAGLFLVSAPAFAQESTAPQTPPASTMTPPPATAPQTPPATTPPAATAPSAGQPPAQAPTMSLSPGMTVRGSDGAELGKLENARQTASGQELLVRGADGVLRGVPVAGIRQDGDAVVVGWTSAQFGAAAAVAEPAPAAPAEPGVTPAAPVTPPAAPPAATPPTLPPENPAAAEPDEGDEDPNEPEA